MFDNKSAYGPLKILELGSSVALSYAGWLFKEMGADVHLLSNRDSTLHGPRGLALRRFNVGKRDVSAQDIPVDSVGRLAYLATFDVLIFSSTSDLQDVFQCSIEELRSAAPGLVLGASTIFGLAGPYSDVAATELDAQALSGVSWVLGSPEREPLSVPAGIVDCQAGVNLASACLLAVLSQQRTGMGHVVDIALADVLATYVGVNATFYIYHGLKWERAGRRAYGSGGTYPLTILPCKDGEICLCGRSKVEWYRFIEAMGKPAWTKEPRYQSLRAMGMQYPEEADERVSAWTLTKTTQELEEIIDQYTLTAALLRPLEQVLETPHFLDRKSILTVDIGTEQPVKAVAIPFIVSDKREEHATNKTKELLRSYVRPEPSQYTRPAVGGKKPLEGTRILDLGWVWSAPWVGGVLAEFGAEVIKVEHAGRLDNARMSGRVIRNGIPVEGDTSEMSPMFHQINHGKKGITLNLKEPRAAEIIKSLVKSCDVVIENMAPGAMERARIGYAELAEHNPDIIMLSMSGAGQFGPLAEMRTYAPLMSSFVGLDSLVGYEGESPIGCIGFGVGDPNATSHGLLALMAALFRRNATGKGCYIDLSQVVSLLGTLTPYLLQAQIDGAQPKPAGNSAVGSAPRGIYPTRDGKWVSIDIENDQQWLGLSAAVDIAAWNTDPTLGTYDGRAAQLDMVNAELRRWTATVERDGLVQRLRRSGVPCSPVLSIEEQVEDEHFQCRELRARTYVPLLGDFDVYRAPWRISGMKSVVADGGPSLGQHNVEVFSDILAMSPGEIESLIADGVIS